VWGSALRSPRGLWGRAPAEIEFGAFLLTAGGGHFNDFAENQLTCVPENISFQKI